MSPGAWCRPPGVPDAAGCEVQFEGAFGVQFESTAPAAAQNKSRRWKMPGMQFAKPVATRGRGPVCEGQFAELREDE